MSDHPAMRSPLILLCIATFAANPAHAYCIGSDTNAPTYDPHYYSVATEFRRSAYVVAAKVLDERWIGEHGKPRALRPPFQNGGPRPWGFDPYLGAFYDVRVETSFKGRPPQIIALFSENSTARFWLKPGTRLLLFIGRETFDKPIGGQWTIDTCGNSALFPKANSLLAAVRRAAGTRR